MKYNVGYKTIFEVPVETKYYVVAGNGAEAQSKLMNSFNKNKEGKFVNFRIGVASAVEDPVGMDITKNHFIE